LLSLENKNLCVLCVDRRDANSRVTRPLQISLAAGEQRELERSHDQEERRDVERFLPCAEDGGGR